MYPRLYEPYGGVYPNYYFWSGYYYSDPRLYYYGYSHDSWHQEQNEETRNITLQDYGDKPFVVDIEDAAEQNRNYRLTLWTGSHLQVTLMSLMPGEDIGLEAHPNVDQFLRIQEGRGLVQMGNAQNNLYFEQQVGNDYAIMVPAGMWHNLTNTGNKPLKLYSIYAPVEHPFGTVHETKQAAQAAEASHT